MAAPGLPPPTLARRLDVASYKKAINTAFAAGTLAGGVDAMCIFSVAANPGDPTNIAFYAGSDVPGGDFETLVVKPWLEGSSTPTAGPAGLGLSPTEVAAAIATLRVNAVIIAQAVGGSLAGGLSKVATTGAYADLSGQPTIPDVSAAIEAAATSGATLTLAGLIAFFSSLPTTTPTTPGVLYLNGGVPTLSQAD